MNNAKIAGRDRRDFFQVAAAAGLAAAALQRMMDWNGLPEKVVTTARSPARCLQLKSDQRLTGTGMLATMAPGLPYAVAAKLAYPDRPALAVGGDGGFAMLMAELTTAVANKLPVKIVILKNNSLAEVKFEQKEIGNPEFGCDLAPIDFVAFAKACGAEGFRCERPPTC